MSAKGFFCSFLNMYIMYSQFASAQYAATEVSSLGTVRDEVISFVKFSIVYLKSSTAFNPYQATFSAVQGINFLLSTVPYRRLRLRRLKPWAKNLVMPCVNILQGGLFPLVNPSKP